MIVKKSSLGLLGIYRKYGLESLEFYNYSKGFFEYVIRRYNNQVYDEDIHHFCYLRVLESALYGFKDKEGIFHPPYYNPKKTNLVTFVFSTIRNAVSSLKYRESKRVDNFEVLTEVKEDENIDFDWYQNLDYEDKKLEYGKTIGVEKISTIRGLPSDNPIVKTILWETAKSEFFSEMVK